MTFEHIQYRIGSSKFGTHGFPFVSFHNRVLPGAVVFIFCCTLLGCRVRDVIGSVDTDNSDFADTNDGTVHVTLPLPLVFDFDTDDNGVNDYNSSIWEWNEATGTYDVDITFAQYDEYSGFDFFLGEGVALGGVDFTAASRITYVVQTLDSNTGYALLYIQSIMEEGPTQDDEVWLWYSENVALKPNEGWVTYTMVLDEVDTENVNLEEVTKIGFQVHSAIWDTGQDESDTAEEHDLPTFEHIAVQVDSISIE